MRGSSVPYFGSSHLLSGSEGQRCSRQRKGRYGVEHWSTLSCPWGLPQFPWKCRTSSTLIVWVTGGLAIFLLRWCHSYFRDRKLLAFPFTTELPRNHLWALKICINHDSLGGKYQQRCPIKSFCFYRLQEKMCITVIVFARLWQSLLAASPLFLLFSLLTNSEFYLEFYLVQHAFPCPFQAGVVMQHSTGQ